MKKNILIHDYFENFGGGERVVLSLQNHFDKLYFGFCKNKNDIFDDTKKNSIDKRLIPIASKNYFWLNHKKKNLPKLIMFFVVKLLFIFKLERCKQDYVCSFFTKIIFDPDIFYKNSLKI